MFNSQSVLVFSCCILLFTGFIACIKDDKTNGDNQNFPGDDFICLLVSSGGNLKKDYCINLENKEISHDVRSVTKSIIATLCGIAIERGHISSVNDSIGKYLTPLVGDFDSLKANTRIEHLLQMSAGLEGNELYDVDGFINWANAPDQVIHTLNKRQIKKPGSEFNYDSGVSHLVSVIISQSSGISTKEFAKKQLFNQLGIIIADWKKDNRNIELGAAGLKISAYGMLKIGNLYLDSGAVKGNQLVSKDWIKNSISPKISTNRPKSYGQDYGYYWWVGHNTDFNYVYANGWGGQFIVLVPSHYLVVVATNRWEDLGVERANKNWSNTMSYIVNTLIPNILESKSI